MDGYLLDTNAVSALLDPQHKNHKNVQDAVDAIELGSPKYVSRIAIAEVMFGAFTDKASTGHDSPRTMAILRQVESYPIQEISKHTATEWAQLRTKLAITYLPGLLKSQRPRWVEDWTDRATARKLGVDENDLWICAQALEWDLILITTDEDMVTHLSPVDPMLKFLLIRSV